MPFEGTAMLEALISSRIRRALFEHILTHPSERFYLRGLAKSLSLSVSPLRRELKRLEHSGMLRTAQEGNMLFYTVNAESTDFVQLQQASQHAKAPSPDWLGARGSGLGATAVSAPRALTQSPQPTAQSRMAASWRAPLPIGALLGAAGLGAALLIIVASLLYVRLTSREQLSQASWVIRTRKAEQVSAPRQASSLLRGRRWQVSPGGFGGFSSGAGANTGARY